MIEMTATLDLSALEKLLDEHRSHVGEGVVRQLGQMAYDTWSQLATEQLHTSRSDYLDALSGPHIDGTTAYVDLVGSFPNMIEHGVATPIDMREVLLDPSDPHVNRGADGKLYRDIRFAHSKGPGFAQAAQRGRSALGKPLGYPYRGHSAAAGAGGWEQLGRELYDVARKLVGKQRIASVAIPPRLKQRHSAAIYSGLRRSAHGGFETFRRITEDSDGWIYPVTVGKKLAEATASEIEKRAADVVQATIIAAMG